MGGCRCSYKSCRNTTKTTQNLHFFHYPVKQKERCKAWINRACKPKFFDLDEYQLRNKVICEVHFADNCFLNSEKKRLLPQAIPTLDGDYLYDEPPPVSVYSNMKDKIKQCPKSPKMDDIQVLPANEDGTVFVLDTIPSYKVNKEMKSYILNDDALFPIERKDSVVVPRIKEEPVFHDQEEYILGDNDHFSIVQQSTPLRKMNPPPLKQGKPNYEILNSDSPTQTSPMAKTMTNEAIESLICRTVESKYLDKFKQHTKDLNKIKRALKMSNNKVNNRLNKHSVLRYLKLRLPPSLHTLVNLSLNDDYELNEEDENFFKNLHDSSTKTYQFLSDDCNWRMPIIEIHEGDPDSMEEN